MSDGLDSRSKSMVLFNKITIRLFVYSIASISPEPKLEKRLSHCLTLHNMQKLPFLVIIKRELDFVFYSFHANNCENW